MKRFLVILVLVAILLSGCAAIRHESSLVVGFMRYSENDGWKVRLMDEYGYMVEMAIWFDSAPDFQVGDRVTLTKVED